MSDETTRGGLTMDDDETVMSPTAHTVYDLGIRGEKELTSLGMGPVTLDLALARQLGWGDTLIAEVAHACYLVVRGANLSHAFVVGRACEHCGGASPRDGACVICGREAKA